MGTAQVITLFEPQIKRDVFFDEFWSAYHTKRRVKKSACRVIFEQITSPAGYTTRTTDRDSGRYVDIHLQATAEEIITGAKAYYYVECVQGETPLQYIVTSPTFLNQGRWEDFEDAEELAARLDKIRERL